MNKFAHRSARRDLLRVACWRSRFPSPFVAAVALGGLMLSLPTAGAFGAPAQTRDTATQRRTEGLTPGAEKSVDLHNGSFNHQVEIDVPEFRDLAPDLALSFNSSGGNGFVGVGWSLQGFSAIERVSSESHGTRRCANEDDYTLDGEPLVTCTKFGGTHCTKNESFLRIRFDAATERWTIWDTDGTKRTYTKNFDIPGSLPNASCPYRYGLSTVEDLKGNRVTYNWFHDVGEGDVHKEVYPASVIYNGVTVTFYRELRPDPISYANGFDWTNQKQRLRSIAVTVNSAGAANNGTAQLLRAYALQYQTGPSGRSQLTAVRNYGRDARVDAAGAITSGAVLATKSFAYGGGSVGFGRGISSSDLSDASGWTDINNYATIRMADVDGDGRTDLCARANAGIYCYRQTGQGWTVFPEIRARPALSDAQGWGAAQYYSTIQFPDLNGDGRADFCARGAAGLTCSYNEGASPAFSRSIGTPGNDLQFSNDWSWSNEVYYSTIQFPDVNGDGKADVCARSSSNVFCYLQNADGTGWGSYVTGPAWTNADGWNSPQYYSTIQFPDINGDGRADVCGRSAAGIRCHLSAGTSFDLATTWLGPDWSNAGGWSDAKYYSTIQYPDINGDGKADVCARGATGMHCHLAIGSARLSGVAKYAFNTIAVRNDTPSDASGFGAAQYYSTIQFADINGDGRDDLCWRDSHGITCDRSNGTSFARALTGSPAWSNAQGWGDISNYSTIRFIDLDGDGKADLFGRANAGLVGILTNGDGTERLTAVTNNGMGGSIRVAYAPSSSFPDTSFPRPEQVVTAMHVDDGRGGVATTTFSFSGGRFDRANKRSLGFRYVKETRPAIPGEAAAPYDESWFMQAPYGCVGQVDLMKRSTGAGRLLAYTQNTYQPAGSGGGPFTCLLDQESRHVYDQTGTSTCTVADNVHCKRTDTNYDYDSYGNVTVRYDYGDYFDPADDTTEETFYNRNVPAYIVDTASVNRLHPGIGTASPMIEETQTFYDDATTLDAAPSAGYPTMTQVWVSSVGGPNPAPAYVKERKGYDSVGNVAWEEDALGHRTTHGYDAVFRSFRLSTTNPLGQTGSTTWDTVCGAPLTETDLNSQVTRFTYDNFCRLTRKDEPLGKFEAHSYSPRGNATEQWERVETPSSSAVAGNMYVVTYLDGLDRTYRSQQRGPDAAVADDILVDTAFDARGNVRTQSLPRYEGAAPTVTTFEYDALDRSVRAVHADGNTVSTAYDLWTTMRTDEEGRQVARRVDAEGRVVAVSEREGAAWNVAMFTYDRSGNPSRTVDPVGNVTSYAYNSVGQKLSQQDPDLGASSYTYDANGRLASHTDARGRRTEHLYDALGRAVTKRFGADTGNPQLVTYRYDEARTGFANVGHLTTMVDASGSVASDWDAAERLVREIHVRDGKSYTLRHAYDAGDRLIGTRFPDGDFMGDDPGTAAAESPLRYDGAGRLNAIPGLVDNVVYSAAGPATLIANANGTTTTRAYSAHRGWLDGMRTARAGVNLQDLKYQRRRDGKITGVASPFTGESWTYGYDVLGRLSSANATTLPNEQQTFSYDKIGNILSNSRLGAYSYGASGGSRPHAVLAAGGAMFTYDAVGNMLTGRGRTYEWDAANRLVKVTTPENVSTFSYDGNGERIQTIHGGAATRFLGRSYEVGPDGAVTKYFRLGGEVVAKKVGAARFWLHPNHLDSVAVITDQAGNEVRRENHRAYGEVLDTASSGAHTQTIGYTGQRVDQTGLIYMNARYYDPVIGRFLSPDSVTPGDQIVALNRYAYGENDPINHVDPTGHFSWGKFALTMGTALVIASVCATGVGCMILAGASVMAVGIGWDRSVEGKQWNDKQMWTENAVEGAAAGVCLGLCPKLGHWITKKLSSTATHRTVERAATQPAPALVNRELGRRMGIKAKEQRDAYNEFLMHNQRVKTSRLDVHQGVKHGTGHVSSHGVGHGLGAGAAAGTVHAIWPKKKTYVPQYVSVPKMRPAPRKPYVPTYIPKYVQYVPHYRPAPAPSRGGCFVAGTRVTLADGTSKPIERIREGDHVMAFDEQSGNVVTAPVTKLFVHEDWQDHSATVLINGRLRATPNHPFFANETWRRAEHMATGDILRRFYPATEVAAPSTLPEAVETLELMPGVDTVYNLEVDRYHTYFAEGLLVHNAFTK